MIWKVCVLLLQYVNVVSSAFIGHEQHVVVRSSGIEPEFDAWKATVLPLYHERVNERACSYFRITGIEPVTS